MFANAPKKYESPEGLIALSLTVHVHLPFVPRAQTYNIRTSKFKCIFASLHRASGNYILFESTTQVPKAVNSDEPKMDEPSTSTDQLGSGKRPFTYVIKPEDAEEEGWAFIKEICSMYENGITNPKEVSKIIPSIREGRRDFEKNYNIEEQKTIFKFLHLTILKEKAMVANQKYFSNRRAKIFSQLHGENKGRTCV